MILYRYLFLSTIFMNKRAMFIAAAAVTAAVVIAATTAFLNKKQKKTIRAPIVEKKTAPPTPTVLPETNKTYVDPSGLNFTYPSSVVVNPQEITDKTIYADIKITSLGVLGAIQITAKDTTLTTVKNWMKREGYNPPIETVKNITLSKIEGMRFIDKAMIVTAAIDQGILFTIIADSQDNDDFWGKVNDGIISSFALEGAGDALGATTDNISPSSSTASDEIDEGVEEVVE